MAKTPPFWPNGAHGALSLTFDDNAPSQLAHALPCLDHYGLKATFYVNPGRRSDWEKQVPRWQQAAAGGHEIGNHTSQHPCSCNFGFHPTYCLEKLNLGDIEATIDEAEAELDRLFPQQEGKRSFCYPCYQSHVGAGVNRQSYVPVVARRFRAARGGGERPNNPLLIDLSYTWAWAVEGHSAEQMITYVEKAVEQGLWAILCMHGVGGDHLAIAAEAFTGLVKHLDQQRRRIWTAPHIEIADYTLRRRTELGA
ncbi:MAG: polysaccharide deacetylase family protein [Candidatus Handelsmanbacteria bacterium]|nr:polysaccharide deacetylase family protein [Candidatus Handelsmanbacteria bacterium]